MSAVEHPDARPAAIAEPSVRPADDAEAPRFVSYAQNFEDVMLWRALGHVEHGFYVDVGAQDPTLDSVSRAFYDRGWVGIDVEPVPRYAALLRAERPRNRVLECALSDRAGREPLYVFGESGLSTLLAAQAERNHDLLGLAFETREVEVRTLRDVLAEAGRDVHWLKVDVEGAEQEVLASWQGSPVHPWIVVVEATRPNERLPSHHEWEPILIEAGYAFVYFDGLNRFYVAPEHPELRGAFDTPPNVFDRFTLAAIDRSERSFRQAEGYATSLEAARRSLEERRRTELDDAARYAASLQDELAARAARLDELTGELERVVRSADAEVVAQRSVAERRGVELGEATVYAATLQALVERTERELASQRDVATRRSAELEQATRYVASLEADGTARAEAFAEAERYARSLEAEVRKLTSRNAEQHEAFVRSQAEHETAAAGFRQALAALETRLVEWQALARRQAGDWRAQVRTASTLLGLPDSTADVEPTTTDAAALDAAHADLQARHHALNAELERIVSEWRRYEQHWYHRLHRLSAVDRQRPTTHPKDER